MTRAVADSSFLIVANGAPDSPPAAALRDYLVARGARRVTAVFHPLGPEHGSLHEITTFEGGSRTRGRRVHLPSRPPLTYPLDLLVPPWPGRVDCWFAFNNMAAARGMLARSLGRAGKVVYWAVDFVPDRFGEGGALTRLYDALDAHVCRGVDLRVELSRPARDGRNERHTLSAASAAPSRIVPIGAWLERVPVASEENFSRRRVVFLGHLVPRQGVGLLIDALDLLAERGFEFEAELAGHGPLEEELSKRVAGSRLADRVRFRGFLSDHRDVERFLADASLATAPYDPTGNTFTRYADPSKLKSYLAAGLPLLTTDVPPTAAELEREAGAEVVPFEAAAWADAIERAFASEEDWRARRQSALSYVQAFDWNNLLSGALSELGFG